MSSRLTGGTPGKCLTCGKLLRIEALPASCAHCGYQALVELHFLSTSAVLTVTLTILAWELKVVVLGVKFLARQNVDPVGHTVLLIASAVLTIFAHVKGKSEIDRIKKLGGRAAMTWFQAALLVLILFSFAWLFALLGFWQRGWR